MNSKISKKPWIFLFVFLFISYFALPTPQDEPEFYAHFINVGQGDATLLEFPCGAILIDTGAQNNDYVTELTDYLTDFFEQRSDLDNTLETVFITHNHEDHTNGLKEVIEGFTVKRLIHNGTAGANETGDLSWAIDNEDEYNLEISSVSFEDVTENENKNGYTNSSIDPIECIDCDPQIIILSGEFEENPGWTMNSYGKENNHSLVIRVDFGNSSFLFTGDLEEKAIEKIVQYYLPSEENVSNLLDIDVYQVGHHGSHNATTVDLLKAMTPKIAIVPVGRWEQSLSYNTYK